MTLERRRVPLSPPSGGWLHPWPNVFELAREMATDKWTLVGGLMVQAHALAHGVKLTRPTDDVDVLLHIEIDATAAVQADEHITALGYQLREPADPRRKSSPHYRYERASLLGTEKIDVMAADHTAPRSKQLLRGRPMFTVDGGTQALRRTMAYVIDIGDGDVYEISIPDELAALVLKGAAHLADNRDRERHLQDAAVLAACITDHSDELGRLAGSDRKRIRHLADALSDPSDPAWLGLDEPYRTAGQDTLRILASPA